ncbi:4-hydroxyphenylacetate catabolism regulatory protein HpaA [Vibrio sp. Isolate31]|uniref:4-hydroxyphenylacetate catabolism regulatory protein HpaA n=1 Tax=unclassified Vibrio TaxID=2614977 RepID=UPI001EFE7E60|nr:MULTISPECIES: 4-hydroxyphenylacetate catabolism regulatory protein HpaA [unclassified Vibrio]MCG9554774.1 4-hydroxyphenylacetate catabolism regulatory protein HpaA [Vibrio sp. Isolate32]MCG9601008.1 4-hydroxyphenylacetate catabolism regulatory protein HpaA [Vibrio sp. Isolate31]
MAPLTIPNINIGKVYDSRYEENDFHIEKLDSLALFFGRNMPTHYHDRFYQVHCILEGNTHVLLDESHYSKNGVTLFFTPPTVPHSFVTDDEATGFVITASQTLVWRLLDIEIGRNDIASTAMQPFCIELPDTHRLISWFSYLLQEQESTAFMGNSACQSILQLILIDVLRLADTQPTNTTYQSSNVHTFNQFNQLIELHYKDHWTLPHYADNMGLTTARLNDICRRISGLASKRLVAERVMQEARRLLILTAMSVQEVAYELGFQDPAYFARFFKKNSGETASKFRKKEQ